MKRVADFHVHSKYSQAVSPEMNLQTLARYAAIKGVNLIGTGDFTHPQYFKGIQETLEPSGPGLFQNCDRGL